MECKQLATLLMYHNSVDESMFKFIHAFWYTLLKFMTINQNIAKPKLWIRLHKHFHDYRYANRNLYSKSVTQTWDLCLASTCCGSQWDSFSFCGLVLIFYIDYETSWQPILITTDGFLTSTLGDRGNCGDCGRILALMGFEPAMPGTSGPPILD